MRLGIQDSYGKLGRKKRYEKHVMAGDETAHRARHYVLQLPPYQCNLIPTELQLRCSQEQCLFRTAENTFCTSDGGEGMLWTDP
jgi:hypothetical protein